MSGGYLRAPHGIHTATPVFVTLLGIIRIIIVIVLIKVDSKQLRNVARAHRASVAVRKPECVGERLIRPRQASQHCR